MYHKGDPVHLYKCGRPVCLSVPDSSDRFKTLKTDSILPYIWPCLNPLANSHYWMAEQRLAQRGAIPIQILPSSFLLSYISLISPFLSAILGFSLHLLRLFKPSFHLLCSTILHTKMCLLFVFDVFLLPFFSPSLCQCPCSF